MNPYAALAGLLLFLAAVAGSFIAGVRVEGDHRDAQLLAQERGYQADYHRKALAANAIANRFEGKRHEIRTVTQTITQFVDKIVDRPVYRDVCLDPDGLRAANAALLGTADPGQPDPGLPRPDPAR